VQNSLADNLFAELAKNIFMADLKATHVSRVTSILQTVLIAFHEKLEEKSAHKHHTDLLCNTKMYHAQNEILAYKVNN